jgi:hypothetical protein
VQIPAVPLTSVSGLAGRRLSGQRGEGDGGGGGGGAGLGFRPLGRLGGGDHGAGPVHPVEASKAPSVFIFRISPH